jgi:hypothetical protein
VRGDGYRASGRVILMHGGGWVRRNDVRFESRDPREQLPTLGAGSGKGAGPEPRFLRPTLCSSFTVRNFGWPSAIKPVWGETGKGGYDARSII